MQMLNNPDLFLVFSTETEDVTCTEGGRQKEARSRVTRLCMIWSFFGPKKIQAVGMVAKNIKFLFSTHDPKKLKVMSTFMIPRDNSVQSSLSTDEQNECQQH